MCSALGDAAVFQNDNFVAIIDCPQAVCDKDTRPRFFLQDAVDVLQKSVFGMCVEGRSLRHVSIFEGQQAKEGVLLRRRTAREDFSR